ncbi:MAG: hypothetical protein QOK24_1237 [Verrucomicrobiota bacterium]|jgi:hypothetical protein
MKFLIFSVALILCAAGGRAQEPPLPVATETPSARPAAPRPELNIPEIPLTVEPTPLVPNTSPAPKKSLPPISELDAAFKQSPLAQAAEEYRLHVEWRELQNRTAHDPEVVAAKAAADKMKTDLERRARLREYYTIYYAHMLALASTPELKAYLEGKRNGALDGLAQSRVRPKPTATPSPKP